MLHKQEERGQGALGRVGVRRRALALGLVAARRVRAQRTCTQQAMLLEGARDPAGQVGQVEAGSVPVQDGVRVVDVRARQVGDGGLELR